MMKQKRILTILNQLSPVPPPNPLRQAAARGAYLQQAARLRAARLTSSATSGHPLRLRLRPLILAIALASLVLFSLGGTAYAADQARPGDPLYPLDRSLETFRLRLTRNPQRAAALRLAFADERLDEAESLAASGDAEHLPLALEAYTETILTLSPSPAFDATLSRQETRLRQLWARAPERARHGLERALEAAEKARSSPPSPPPPAPTTPSSPTPTAPPEPRHGPPEDRPDKATTKTPHRPPQAGPPQDKGSDKGKGND